MELSRNGTNRLLMQLLSKFDNDSRQNIDINTMISVLGCTDRNLLCNVILHGQRLGLLKKSHANYDHVVDIIDANYKMIPCVHDDWKQCNEGYDCRHIHGAREAYLRISLNAARNIQNVNDNGIIELEETNRGLEGTNKELKQRCILLEEEIKNDEERNKEFKEKFRVVDERNEELKEKNKEFEESNKELKQRCILLEEEIKNDEERNKDLKKQLEESRFNFNDCLKDENVKFKEIRRLQIVNSTLNSTVNDYYNSNIMKDMKIQNLNEHITNLKNSSRNEHDRLSNAKDKEIQNIKNQAKLRINAVCREKHKRVMMLNQERKTPQHRINTAQQAKHIKNERNRNENNRNERNRNENNRNERNRNERNRNERNRNERNRNERNRNNKNERNRNDAPARYYKKQKYSSVIIKKEGGHV